MEKPNIANHTESESVINVILEGFLMVKNVLKSLFISIFRFFIPQARKSVKGEIVLITGSGGSLGRQLSKEFSRLGARVVLWDISEENNQETCRQIRQQGGTCYTYTCDVGNRHDVYQTGERVRREVGEVSILINNAGVVTGRKLLECPDHMIEKTFNVNLLGQFWTVRCFLPSMLERNHGHVVNIASSNGLIGLKNLTDYSASKFGVVGFTEVLNYEIVFGGHTGVYTSLVCSSFIKTSMFEGCTMRFPAVLPPLEVSYSVDRIMQGILTNQNFICIPRIIYFFCMLKTMLPVDAMNEIIKFFGAASFMDTFIGHDEKRPNERPNGNAVMGPNGNAVMRTTDSGPSGSCDQHIENVEKIKAS